MIQQAIYWLLTVIIPLRMTYHSTRHNDTETQKLWAVYWAFYFGFKSLQWNCWLLEYRVIDFVFILFALWLYNDSYKGGLFLADFITQTGSKIPAVSNLLNTIKQRANLVPLFEHPPATPSTSGQSGQKKQQ